MIVRTWGYQQQVNELYNEQTLKKKKTEKALSDELKLVNKQYEELKKKYEELEFTYNKSCCLEQELNEQIKQKGIENAELDKKYHLLVYFKEFE